MDPTTFDALARSFSASSRRGLLIRLAALLPTGGLVMLLSASGEARGRRHGRHRGHHPGKKKAKRKGQKGHKAKNQQRQYPIFTTCYTADGELGPIPDGPHATCQSTYDPDEFVPCNSSLTFADLKAKCDEAFPACNGECRILAEPIAGLGDCPNFTDCVVTNGPQQPIPGAPYASCWSGPDWRCETCPNEKPDYQGLKDLCGTTYPAGHPITCWDRLGRNDCYPIGCDAC